VAGYTTKKLTTPDNEDNYDYRKSKGLLLGCRIPEYSSCSQRPPIGGAIVEPLVASIKHAASYTGECITGGSVPFSVRVGTKYMPLGHTIRKRVAEALGVELTVDYETANLLRVNHELQILQNPQEYLTKKFEGSTPAERVQKALNAERKHEIFNQRSL
jgi:hypothetical protein